MENTPSYERYQRQVLLNELGELGQQKLMDAKVLVIGAGGLGCPVLQYLAAAGIGTIGIVDDDIVALHNLHRQPLYSTEEIGLPKAILAAGKMRALNPGITINYFNETLTVQNAIGILKSFDIVVDATDNFATRYLVNDVSVLLKKTLVYGAISRYEGQVAVFNCNTAGQSAEPANYRDLFPDPPAEGEILNCAEAGVLGVLPGIIGAMMANETIKIIAGIGKPLINRMLTFNALNNQSFEFEILPRPNTRSMIPGTAKAFEAMDYKALCAAAVIADEIEPWEFDTLISSGNVDVIDVRERDEKPFVNEFEHFCIPAAKIGSRINELNQSTIVLFCQTGQRSRNAAGLLTCIFGDTRKVFSLKGGIQRWKQQHKSPAQ